MSIKNLPEQARPREKLLRQGPEALSDAELLAILLRTGLAGKGVLALSESLLQPCGKDPKTGAPTKGFHGLTGLLHASVEDLANIKGLGPAKRAVIVAVMELAKRALAQQLQQRDILNSVQAVRQYLQLHLNHKNHEVFVILFLDSQMQLIALEEMFRGTLNQASVYPREVATRALQLYAHSVVLAHNHPSGNIQPSEADITITQRMQAALNLLDIKVVDHFIITQGQSLSMAEQGLL